MNPDDPSVSREGERSPEGNWGDSPPLCPFGRRSVSKAWSNARFCPVLLRVAVP